MLFDFGCNSERILRVHTIPRFEFTARYKVVSIHMGIISSNEILQYVPVPVPLPSDSDPVLPRPHRERNLT
jgi:hypothetical protein